MSSTAPPLGEVAPAAAVRPEAIVDRQLQSAGRQVRWVDAATGALGLLVGLIAVLFLAALADHWVFSGGMGPVGRWLIFLTLSAVGGFCGYRYVLRPLVLRVSPIYVAQTIEQSGPSLKNSLINFLLLRQERRHVAPAVLAAVERRAADDVLQVPPEDAIDRRHVLRLAYVLVALVLVGAIYHVVSPKNPLRSAFRMVLPWADVAAPTRVTIGNVRPGDVTVYHGEQVLVSAEAEGLRADEPLLLRYTTADGQSVDQAIPMAVPEGKYRFECTLPADDWGVQQDVRYYLAAGDCRTRQFTVTVETPPTIDVQSIEYHYPDYTGLANRTVPDQGDVRAVEGTEVTVRAKANRPIDSAEIDLGCTGRRGLRMSVKGPIATGAFTLRLRSEEPGRAEYDAYQLRFVDAAGRENRRPARYSIEVVPDLPPEVRLVDPPEEHIELPLDAQLDLVIEARDPDFALRGVALRAEREGKSLPLRPLLDRARSEEPYQGVLRGTVRFEPLRLGLAAGDKVVYWAEAKDNKTPLPGRSETPRRWITITEPRAAQPPQGERPPEPGQNPPDKPPEPNRQQPEPGQDRGSQPDPAQQQQQPQQGAQDEGPQGPGAQGETAENPENQDQGAQSQAGQAQGEGRQDQGQGAQDQGQGAQDQGQSVQDRGQGTEDQDQGAQGQGGENQPGQNDAPSNDPAAGQQGAGGNQRGQDTQQNPSEPIDGQTNPGDVFEQVLKHRQQNQQPNQSPTGQSQPGEPTGQPQPGQRQPGQQQPNQPPPGQQQPGQKQPGQQPPNQSQPRQQQPGQKQPGQEQTEGQRPGQQPSDNQQPAGQQPGQRPEQQQPGQERPGQERPGERQPGQERPGQQTPASSQPTGETQAGQETPAEPQPGREPEPGQPPTGQGQETPGQPQADQPQSGQPQSGEPQLRQAQPGGQEQPGQPPSGQEQPGGQPQGQPQPGQSPTGEGASGQPPASHPAAGVSPESEPGEGRPDQKSPDDRTTTVPPGQESSSKSGQSSLSDPKASGQSGQSGSQQSPPGENSEQPQPSGTGSHMDMPRGGGPNTAQSRPDVGEEPGEDAFNKDYAQKQTDLALEYLKDQLAKEKPDQDLLEALGGWTREDLADFARRWEAMKRAAEGDSPRAQQARRELDEALRSLGLHGRRSQIDTKRPDDALRGMYRSRRIAPPPGWEEQIDAYRRGIGAGP